MLKKMLSLLLAMVFCFALFAGCGGNTDDTTAAPQNDTTASVETTEATEPAYTTPDMSGIKITQYARANVDYDPEGSYVNKAVEKHLGLDLEIIELDSATEQINNMIAEKKPPELLFVNNYTHANWAGHGNDGAFINLYEYLDQMPNVKAYVEDPANAAHVKAFTYSEGVMYALPISTDGAASVTTFLYRKDVFDANNLKWPTNQEEFVQVLRDLKKIYPDSQPFVMRWLTKNMQGAQAFGHLWGGIHLLKGHYGTYFTLDEDGNYYLAQIGTAYKEMAQFFHDLTAEGLMHGSSMTIDNAGWEEAFASGKSFIGYDNVQRLPVLNAAGQALNPDFLMVAGEAFNFGTHAKETDVVSTSFPAAATSYGWMVGSTSGEETINNVLKYVDWLYSEEGITMTNWGIEGESYVVNEDGTKSFKEGFLDANGGLTATGLYQPEMSGYQDFETYMASCTPYLAESIAIGQKHLYNSPAQYYLTYNEEEQFVWDTYATTMYNYINGEWGKFVLGHRDFSEWDNLLQELKDKYHYDEILKIHESALARVLEEQA